MTETDPVLPYRFARTFGVLVEDDRILFRRNATLPSLAEAQRVSGIRTAYTPVSDVEFTDALKRVYEQRVGASESLAEDLNAMDLESLVDSLPESEDLLAQDNDAPVIRLINALFSEAIRLRASDIHIETFESQLLVRFRIDGVLRDILEPRRALASMLISRIKVMAKLDIAEKRIPQDGRLSVRLGDHEVDVRVSTLPVSSGERVVMRLLERSISRLNLDRLGMQAEDRSRFEQLLARPNGIILVTGPTGSGKTTSLYAGLLHIRDGRKNIMTIEDPIEYQLPGVAQTQVNLRTDMTFARGLRSILRQDPDVVMVGEIRDLETAQIAVQASLTGHLVLSTLHTNTAIGAITRLANMGVEPFLIASSLECVIAQRLVRTLCEQCKTPYSPDPAELARLKLPPDTILHRPAGCDACLGQGYLGRTGIYEVIEITPELEALLHAEASEPEMMRATGVKTLLEDGLMRVREGITSLEEVLRVVQDA